MKIAYKNAKILDGSEQMTPQTGKIVLTEGEHITAIVEDGADLTSYEVVDLQGQYLMPGLVNMHVHIPSSGKPSKKEKDVKKTIRLVTANRLTRKIIEYLYKSFGRTELFSGVTTLRTMGGVENYDGWLRDQIYAGKADGPRILASNMAVSVPGGHMAGSLAYEAHNAEEAAGFVRKIAQDTHQPDVIKLMITGGVLDATEKGEPGVLRMQPDLVKAACDAAHQLGLKVAAHVESPEGVRIALENGVDTIEHGALPDEEILELFRKTGAVHVATLSPALPFALFDRSVSYCSEMAQYNGKIVFDGIVACAKACLEAGIPVGLGTDTGCPFITHYDMWRELYWFHKYCGVSNTFALYTGTKRNAELLGLGDVTGSIAPGKCADFIVTKQNPLDDLQALRNLEMVVARGKRYPAPKVKKMPQVERELDRFL